MAVFFRMDSGFNNLKFWYRSRVWWVAPLLVTPLRFYSVVCVWHSRHARSILISVEMCFSWKPLIWQQCRCILIPGPSDHESVEPEERLKIQVQSLNPFRSAVSSSRFRLGLINASDSCLTCAGVYRLRWQGAWVFVWRQVSPSSPPARVRGGLVFTTTPFARNCWNETTFVWQSLWHFWWSLGVVLAWKELRWPITTQYLYVQ